MMYNMKIKNNFFCGLSPILNRQIATLWTILKFFWLHSFFKWKRSDPRWAVGSIPILITPILHTFSYFFFSHIFTFEWRRKKYICLGKTQSICTFSLFHVIQNSKMELIYLWAGKFLVLLFFKWWKTVLMT